MTAEPLTIRPAVPTVEEGQLFARYLDVAAEGFFEAMLGKHYDRVIGDAYLSSGHDLSYETVVFAEQSGRIVGMASGYTSRQHGQWSDVALREAAGFRVVRMAAFSLFARNVLRFMENVPSGDYYLQAIAVDEESRGANVGSTLLDYSESRAREAGCTRIVLDVLEANVGGRRLYERRGMTVEAKSPSFLFVSDMRVWRMVKPL